MNADQLMPLQEAVRSAGTAVLRRLGLQDPPPSGGKSISEGVKEGIRDTQGSQGGQGAIPPAGGQEGAAETPVSFLDSLASVEWVDWTAIVLLAVFFLLGLFKGLVWQVSRIVSLVAAWFLAGQFGPNGAELLGGMFDPATSPEDLPLFLSYVIIFVMAVVLISLIAWGLQKFVKETGMTMYDRLGGAVLGLGTGSLGVMVILAGLYMFIPADIALVEAAKRSHSMDYSRKALEVLGDTVPDPMKKVFGLAVEPDPNAKPGSETPGSPQPGSNLPGSPQPGETPKTGTGKKTLDPSKLPKNAGGKGK